MAMLLKACERCRGDMQVGSDVYGSYNKCVQCGHLVESQTDLAFVHVDAPVPAVAKAKKIIGIDAA